MSSGGKHRRVLVLCNKNYANYVFFLKFTIVHVEGGDSGFADREVLVEEVAPVVLDVEKEAKDQGHVHEADEDNHHHPAVY